MGNNPPPMQETWVQSLVWEDPLEEGMATHSSILAWRTPMERISWGLPSMRSQWVRHNWVTTHSTHIWIVIIMFFSCSLAKSLYSLVWLQMEQHKTKKLEANEWFSEEHSIPVNICDLKKNIFIWLRWVLAIILKIFDLCYGMRNLLTETYGILFPDQGWNLGPLHWDCGVLATGPPGKSNTCDFLKNRSLRREIVFRFM